MQEQQNFWRSSRNSGCETEAAKTARKGVRMGGAVQNLSLADPGQAKADFVNAIFLRDQYFC